MNQLIQKTLALIYLCLLALSPTQAQNSKVGDGFGGRLWYKPYNYCTGSYSAYTICGEDHQLFGWGSNVYEQLGDGTQTSSVSPVAVHNMNHVIFYSTGYTMGAIKDDYSGWTWGCPWNAGYNTSEPQKVLDDVNFVDAGISSCAFVKIDGTVWSVGANNFGEFGNGLSNEPYSITPKQMSGITHAVRTAQGEYTTAVLLSNGEVWAAGNNALYGLGNANTLPSLTAVKINGLPPLIDIKSNSFATIGLDSFGNVWLWGTLMNSQSTALSSNPTPIQLTTLSNIVAISGCNDGFHFLALDSHHVCYGWGDNSAGQLGLGHTMSSALPVKITDSVDDILAGEWYTYIIKQDGRLWCSGSSGNGGSIWLNLSNMLRTELTELDLTTPEFNLCGVSNTWNDSLIPPPVHVPPVLDTPIVFFPNVFSANNDGRNDVFRAIIKDASLIENFDLKLFNRYGNLVFHTQRSNQGWRGYASDIGTYYYVCNYKQKGKRPIMVKGDVTLLR